jgi:hypothetical protein
MKHLSLTQAARKVGKPKSAILRAIQDGRLAAPRAANGHYEIDPAKLLRAFPPEGEPQPEHAAPIVTAQEPDAAPTALAVASDVAIAERPAAPVHAEQREAAPAALAVASDVAIAERPAAPVHAEQREAAPAALAVASDVAIAERPAAPVHAEQPEAAPTEPAVASDVAIAEPPATPVVAKQPEAKPGEPVSAPEVANAELPKPPVDVVRQVRVNQDRPAQPRNVSRPPRGPFSNVMDPVTHDAKRLLRYLQGLVTPRNSK